MKKDSTRTGATLCSSMRPRSATTSWLNKFKLLAFAFMALLSINVWGETATFGTDWNSQFGTSYSGAFNLTANELTLSASVNNVSFTANNNSSTSGYVKTSDFRMYNGYTLTITAPANNNITSIVGTSGNSGKYIAGISANVGLLSYTDANGASCESDADDVNVATWTGSANSVVFTASATNGFETILVTYSSTPLVTYTDLSSGQKSGHFQPSFLALSQIVIWGFFAFFCKKVFHIR